MVPAPRSPAIGAADPEELAMIRHGLPFMMAVSVAPRSMGIGVSTPPAHSKLASLAAGSAALRAQWLSDFHTIPPKKGWPAGLLQSLPSTPKPFYP